MKFVGSIRFALGLLAALAITFLGIPQMQAQQNWQAAVGAQSGDRSHQALAFLPNEFWIHAGDTITWTAGADDIHTVTFLTAAQIIPSFSSGCPGFTPSGSSFDGSTCVSTPPLAKGQTYAVVFPKAGNYKVICLVHNEMNGTIHVLDASLPLPHTQDFYEDQAERQRKLLFAEGEQEKQMSHEESVRVYSGNKQVAAGVGELLATAGGTQVGSVVRFLKGNIQIHAGDTVEWTNRDPQEPHTITFGPDPVGSPFPPSLNVTVDADGARHATLNSPADTVHSGFIEATLTDDPGLLPENPLDFTRFRITFTGPGTYPYRCVLHDNLGMMGTVVVLP